jgi:hypothetical protein
MRTKPIIIVGIALFVASCATLTSKPVQGPAAPDRTQAQSDGGGQGLGSSQQGPSLNGVDAARSHSSATGLKVDTVRVVGGQLISGAPR